MHGNSCESPLIDFNNDLNSSRHSVDHSNLPGHLSLLKFSDASDSDSSGEKEDQVKLVSHVCGMRDLRKPKNPSKKETWKDGKRFVGGQRKEVLFSVKKNVCVCV